MAVDLRGKPPVIYEIFPRAFLDTSGNGVGDLRGILRKLDYVADLGVDGIWLAPFYPSPLVDAGYDVSDHRAVHPDLGTMEDFDAIIEAADARGLGVVIDLVLNHTSSEDPRFQAALAGDDDAAAHYVFRDPKPDGSAPNNWMSFFGGPAWYWSHEREQYYYHQYTDKQPSLNLRHDAVQTDMQKTVQFWRDRGVSGFRLDVVTAYLFDPSLQNNPPASPEVRAKIDGPKASPYAYQDHVYDMLPGDGAKFTEKLRAWAGDDLWLLGEGNTGNKSLQIAKEFCAPGRLDALYTSDMVNCVDSAAAYEPIFEALGPDQWVTPWWFHDHDHARPTTRLDDVPPDQMARFLAAVLCTMPGALILYQGGELGLPNPELHKNEISDPFELRFWPMGRGRPGARVPIPWTKDAPTFGFTSGTPDLPMRWMPHHSVAAQEDDDASVLAYHRKVLKLRAEHGFAMAADHRLERQDDLLTLHFTARDQNFRAVFNFGATRSVSPQGSPLLETHPGQTKLPKMAARLEVL